MLRKNFFIFDENLEKQTVTKKDTKIAKQLKEWLLKEVPLVDIIVFGSRARGDDEPDSDMDVFIEIERIDPQIKEKIENIVWEVGYENYIFISSLIFTRHEIENTALRVSPIVMSIAKEGIRV